MSATLGRMRKLAGNHGKLVYRKYSCPLLPIPYERDENDVDAYAPLFTDTSSRAPRALHNLISTELSQLPNHPCLTERLVKSVYQAVGTAKPLEVVFLKRNFGGAGISAKWHFDEGISIISYINT